MEMRLGVQSSVAAAATTRELGDLFEYRIPTPVTVRKSESAMLPFLQQKIAARKLLVYSDQSSQHPTNAAELTNATGKTLDGGPITVFDGGAYGGEALVETLKTGDKRLISYAVDLGTRITTQFDSRGDLVRDQERMRQNINSLNQVAGQQQQVQAYAKQLADQEAKLAALRDRSAELQRRRATLETELNGAIEKMEF